ncbi:MAG: MerR family transcriptional regulator [Gemmatimonadota bacterium]|nr:MAG: MerR family transcriptional regulator [Gemmatimonadota bacterium]
MDSRGLLCSSDIIKKLGISLRQLYYWELKGIVRPRYVQMGSRKFKRYTSRDFLRLKQMKESLDKGYTLEAASKKVEEMTELVFGEVRSHDIPGD